MLARDWLTQSRQKGKDPFWRGFMSTHTLTPRGEEKAKANPAKAGKWETDVIFYFFFKFYYILFSVLC